MIQPLFSGMIAILLARFCLNDLPHAAKLLGPTGNSGIRIETNEEVVQDKVQGVAIAWVNSKDVGSLHYELTINGTGEIGLVYVDLEYRGLGVGKKMYIAVEGLAKEYGIREINLEIGPVGVGWSMEASRNFWRSLGFTLEDGFATKRLLANPDTLTGSSWDNAWKSCVQAAKILRKELTEQDIPANWDEMRRLHKDLWAQVYAKTGKREHSNLGNPRIERTTTDKIIDDLERTWHRIETDTSTRMQSALSILKSVMGYYYEEKCVVAWDNSSLVGVAVYGTTYNKDKGLQDTHIKELASFTYKPGVGRLLVEEIMKVGREVGSNIVSASYGPGTREFYERLRFVRDVYYPEEPTLVMYRLKSSGNPYPPHKGVMPKLPEEARGDFLFHEYIRDLCKYEALSGEDAQRLWENRERQRGR